jgi:hypothetical protein
VVSARRADRRVDAALALGLALVGAACCPPGLVAGARDDGPADARIVLYRGRALIEEDVVATVRDGHAILPMPEGVAPAELEVTSDDVRPRSWTAAVADSQREVTAVVGDRRSTGRLIGLDDHGVALLRDGQVEVIPSPELLAGAGLPPLRVEVDGADGPARFRLRYATTRLAWHAAYTLVEDRVGRARLRATLTVDNQTGRRWQRAALVVIDAEPPEPATGVVGAQARSRLPGRYPIAPGSQRLELRLSDRPLPLRSRLVYDPVGSSLDRGQRLPVSDPSYGAGAWPSGLAEAIEVDLAGASEVALPEGPIELATVGADGGLGWRGTGTVPVPVAHAGRTATVTIGRVDDVAGARRQTDLVLDRDRQHLLEEITITVTSQRATAADVVVREHLYRGPCWILGYASTDRIEQIGTQEIALTARVPPGGTAAVVYRVIYKWSDRECGP